MRQIFKLFNQMISNTKDTFIICESFRAPSEKNIFIFTWNNSQRRQKSLEDFFNPSFKWKRVCLITNSSLVSLERREQKRRICNFFYLAVNLTEVFRMNCKFLIIFLLEWRKLKWMFCLVCGRDYKMVYGKILRIQHVNRWFMGYWYVLITFPYQTIGAKRKFETFYWFKNPLPVSIQNSHQAEQKKVMTNHKTKLDTQKRTKKLFFIKKNVQSVMTEKEYWKHKRIMIHNYRFLRSFQDNGHLH